MFFQVYANSLRASHYYMYGFALIFFLLYEEKNLSTFLCHWLGWIYSFLFSLVAYVLLIPFEPREFWILSSRRSTLSMDWNILLRSIFFEVSRLEGGRHFWIFQKILQPSRITRSGYSSAYFFITLLLLSLFVYSGTFMALVIAYRPRPRCSMN